LYEKIFRKIIMNKNQINKNINIILNRCVQIKNTDKVLIIVDESTLEIGNSFIDEVLKITQFFQIVQIQLSKMHGEVVISKSLENIMLKSSVIIGLTKFSLAHTDARYKSSKAGAKYLSLPDYSFALLERESIDVDYQKISHKVNDFSKLLTKTNKIIISSEIGTNLELNIKNRIANSCPGILLNKGDMGSPPDIEANIAIVEYNTNGVLVIDGSIPCKELGVLNEPLKLYIVNGLIVKIKGNKSNTLYNILNNQPKNASIAAELGFGFNPKAKLTGSMLEDEGVDGTVHIGFGSNSTIGGLNKVNFHLDMIIKKPIVFFDDIMINLGKDYEYKK